MILQCVLVDRKIFPTHDDAKLGRERSFHNLPAACSEKISQGLVWHQHSLKISFGLHEHTVMPHFDVQISNPNEMQLFDSLMLGFSAANIIAENSVLFNSNIFYESIKAKLKQLL